MHQERSIDDDDDNNGGVSAATLLPTPSAKTTTTTTTSTCTTMAYLSYEHWSPRYETTFYTVKLVGFELLTESPSSSSSTTTTTISTTTDNNCVGGKTNFPAYYYNIHIFCGHQTHSIKRRYSQFKWLYNQIQPTIMKRRRRRMGNHNNNNNNDNNNDNNDNTITMPPGTCIICFPQNDIFAQNRLEQLREFLCCDLLQKQPPDIAHHPSVVKFLELDKIVNN